MKPLRAVEHGVPVHSVRLHLADRGVSTIVDDDGRTLAGATLGEINTDTIAAADDVVGADALGSQDSHRGIAERIARHSGDVPTVQAKVRETDGHVRFTAAEGGDERRRLQQVAKS